MLVACQSAVSTTVIPTVTLAPSATLQPSATVTATKTVQPTAIPIVTSKRESDAMTMVHIPAGKFRMGSENGEADEGPVHIVYLDAFWMDRTEVTNAMYALCVEAGPCKSPLQTGSYWRKTYYDNPQFGNYPVIYVDWDMASAYCSWAGARLSTEAEWEKAARGETDRTFPWGANWDVRTHKRLNFADKNDPETASDTISNDGHRDTAPVGSYPGGASPYGILDLAGNVWEWVADWYDPSYYRDSPLDNPKGPLGPTQQITWHVLRGGSWVAADETIFHTSNRNGLEPSGFSESIGFRCARSGS
jgi:formylglycine-generating enzyme required for sulfatase activity